LKNIKAVVVLDEAVDDLEGGKTFYESIEEGIGDYFIDCLLSDINSLRINAGMHPIRLDFYRMLSLRFPFAIYYDLDQGIARVAAVLDMRREPAWIRKELQGRSL